jgi:hypothetical protein
VQLSKNILNFTITPETGIKAGTIVTVIVKTTDDVVQVFGFMDMFNTYKYPLKYDTTKNIWYFRQMVPMGVIIPPGDYLAKIEAITKSGEHFYAEKSITIK